MTIWLWFFWEHTLSHKKPIPPPALSTQAKEYKSYQKLLPISPPRRAFWTIRVMYSPIKILELKYIYIPSMWQLRTTLSITLHINGNRSGRHDYQLDHQCLAIGKWKFRTTFFAIIVVWYYLLPKPNPPPKTCSTTSRSIHLLSPPPVLHWPWNIKIK